MALTSPEPLDYEFEPDPETVLRAVVSDLLPSTSLAADVYAYDEAFFAAAACDPKARTSDCLDTAEHGDVFAAEKDKEVLNSVNNKIQEQSRGIFAEIHRL